MYGNTLHGNPFLRAFHHVHDYQRRHGYTQRGRKLTQLMSGQVGQDAVHDIDVDQGCLASDPVFLVPGGKPENHGHAGHQLRRGHQLHQLYRQPHRPEGELLDLCRGLEDSKGEGQCQHDLVRPQGRNLLLGAGPAQGCHHLYQYGRYHIGRDAQREQGMPVPADGLLQELSGIHSLPCVRGHVDPVYGEAAPQHIHQEDDGRVQ